MSGRLDFSRVNRAALAVLPSLLARWLPGGFVQGTEYVAINPRRTDRRSGSFRVNVRTGRWADFAIDGARGGDVVSLAAYLGDMGQVEAAGAISTPHGSRIGPATGMAAITGAVSTAEITPSEAAELAKLVEVFVRTLEANDLDQRLRTVEAWKDRDRRQG